MTIPVGFPITSRSLKVPGLPGTIPATEVGVAFQAWRGLYVSGAATGTIPTTIPKAPVRIHKDRRIRRNIPVAPCGAERGSVPRISAEAHNVYSIHQIHEIRTITVFDVLLMCRKGSDLTPHPAQHLVQHYARGHSQIQGIGPAGHGNAYHGIAGIHDCSGETVLLATQAQEEG